LEELEANKKDFEELEMFTKHEREAEAELINTLRTVISFICSHSL
jgi:hypothetical protein